MQHVNSLYIHFPLCMHLCNYCDFYKKKLTSEEQISDFEKLFVEEWNVHNDFLQKNDRTLGPLETLYIGGGTPSLWRKRGAVFMHDFLKDQRVGFLKDFEYTIEVDPGTCDLSDLEAWIDSGANRFSVGLQAYSNELLKLMDRKHTVEQAQELFAFFKSRNINYSVDLMIGLPSEVDRDIESEIDSIIDFSATHFSVYILKTRKNYIHAKQMPQDERVRKEYLEICGLLEKKGFGQYEISNFAKPGFESKHNQKYWTYDEVAALGPNASGLLVKEDGALRYQWKSQSAGFQLEHIEGESLMIEKIFLGLRNRSGLDFSTLFSDITALNVVQNLKVTWSERGYLVSDPKDPITRLTPLGFLMCDSIIDDVFSYIKF